MLAVARTLPKIRITDFRKARKVFEKQKPHGVSAGCKILPIFLAECTRIFLFFGQ